MATRKRFELLDCPKLAYPSLTEIDAPATAANILERLEGKGFLNYGQIWPRMPDVVAGHVDESYLQQRLSGYPVQWKNDNLQEVMRLLSKAFGGKGRWYKAGLMPIEVLPGAYFKPSIRGTWYHQNQAYSVSINARKHQRVFMDHARFLARGIYEFHSIDDPNDPIPMVVDVSASDNGKRQLKTFIFDNSEMMSLEQFESILRRFFEALALAGVTTVPKGVGKIADLFRKRQSN
jgi:hypothetical protein